MKIYHFGAEDAPVLLLLPGTCCHWKSNFGAVIPLLTDSFRVLCVSYDGFDETEQTEFSTMLEETDYFNQHQVECARRAAKLLTQKLTVHQTIEQLAQDVGLSATALKTCFKGVYGSSVYAYQKEYRLQLAQKLLTETDSTIAEIAHQIGYENPNKFSSAFRQSLGMTPTQYRKRRPIG